MGARPVTASTWPARRQALLAGVLMIVLFVVTACGGPAGQPQPTAEPGPGTPSPSGYYVDPQTAAARQVASWSSSGRTADAEQLRKIADQPIALWVTGDTDQVGPFVQRYLDRATAAGERPLLVVYNIPHRDCGSFSSGGAEDSAAYRSWLQAVVGGLAGRAATVILEPDAVPHELSGCVDDAVVAERPALLTEAISVLKAAGATVYLDAGNPGFVTDVDRLAASLERSGVAKADGFSLNVANFRTTEENLSYGAELSHRLGGAHYVIDTSRNGNGPVKGSTANGAPAYCNPPGRALGQTPTTTTGQPAVDAYLWIKRPGESDGDCRPGEPPAGVWWPDYALDLAKRSR